MFIIIFTEIGYIDKVMRRFERNNIKRRTNILGFFSILLYCTKKQKIPIMENVEIMVQAHIQVESFIRGLLVSVIDIKLISVFFCFGEVYFSF